MGRFRPESEGAYSFASDKSYSFEEAIEIADIRKELLNLANSHSLPKRASDACGQAAWLLIAMREIILSVPFAGYTFEQVQPAMDRLKEIMKDQHEG
jgi:hypothetical protein